MGRLAYSDRDRLLDWFHQHPDAVRGDADRLVARAEDRVRQHASEDAWEEARAWVEERMLDWERGWGFHASDAYVALEVCPLLARSLRNHERHMSGGDEEHLVGRRMMAMFDARGREMLAHWALELGEREHHRAWQEIVNYTRRRGRSLVRSGRMKRDLDWDHTEDFSAKAAVVAGILVAEFESRARGAATTKT